MPKLLSRLWELMADAFFFVVLPGLVLGIVGYLLYAEYQGLHPAPKHHWNQGPQDPEPTQ